MESLTSPIVQITINAAIGLLTIIVSILIYRKQQSRKGITYEVISDNPILSLKKELKGRVQVLFDAKPIDDARLVIIRIWNSGNVPILPQEYGDPIRFDFGENAEILDADVLETIPSNMTDKAKASLSLEAGGVVLEPILLNSRDSITFKVLLAQMQSTREIKVNARIVGINQILNFDKLTFPRRSFARVAIYFSHLLFVLTIIYFILSIYENRLFIKSMFIFIIVISIIFYALVVSAFGSLLYSLKSGISFIVSFKNTMKIIADILQYIIDPDYHNRT